MNINQIKINEIKANNEALKPEENEMHEDSKEKLPNDINNNDNNKFKEGEEKEVCVVNNIENLQEYNTNTLVINNYWIELISKVSFNISLIVFETIGILIFPLIFELLTANFQEAKTIFDSIIKKIGIKWIFIFRLAQNFSIGFFCLTNFSHILNEKDKPIKFLITNLIWSVLFYLISIIILKVIIKDFLFGSLIEKINKIEELDQEIKDKIIELLNELKNGVINNASNLLCNFNNGLDTLLIGSVYITLFTSPKCFKDNSIIFFRLLSILPIAFIILSLIFRALLNLGKINLDPSLSSIFVGPKYTVFGFFISFLLYIKIREKKYKIFDEENNIIPSVFAKISSIIYAIFGFIELLIGLFFPSLTVIGLGNYYLLILCAPIMILYDYKKTYEIHIKPCPKRNIATFIKFFVTFILNIIVLILGLALCALILGVIQKYIQPLVVFIVNNFDYITILANYLYSFTNKDELNL